MGIAKIVSIRIDLNDVNISTSLLPHLVGISIEDIFDTSFTISKMSLDISSKYTGEWNFKDKIKLYLSWNTRPSEVYETNYFYLDYIDDSKSNSGEVYTINALEADLSLGYTYGSTGAITLTNKTVKGYISDFATAFGLTYTESMGSNVVIGTVPIPANQDINQPIPGAGNITKTFKSREEILKYICQTFGYFGNISGKNLQIYRLESNLSIESDFVVPEFNSILDLSVDARYTEMYYRYTTIYARDSNDYPELFDTFNSFNITNKVIDFVDEGAYFNQASGVERAIGAKYLDYLKAFRTNIKSIGFPGFKAGKRFYLNDSYRQYTGLYRCTKVNHRISAQGWIADIEGFPLDSLTKTSTRFTSEYIGQTVIVPDFTYSELISSSLPTSLNATWLDNFARSLNPAYGTTNLGSIFLSECATEGIRADIAFCQMLFETNNWKETTRINRKNSGGIGDVTGTELATFTTWQTGIRAQVQHLFGYALPSSGAGSRPLVNGVVDPRYSFIPRGTAPKVTDLSGKWIYSMSYGSATLAKLKAFYTYLGYKNPTVI
jgi:Mannosyl-glycoprotein endo-beta-N-acetylglucosaminidase